MKYTQCCVCQLSDGEQEKMRKGERDQEIELERLIGGLWELLYRSTIERPFSLPDLHCLKLCCFDPKCYGSPTEPEAT